MFTNYEYNVFLIVVFKGKYFQASQNLIVVKLIKDDYSELAGADPEFEKEWGRGMWGGGSRP